MLWITDAPLITLAGHVLIVSPHSDDYSNECFCFLVWKRRGDSIVVKNMTKAEDAALFDTTQA